MPVNDPLFVPTSSEKVYQCHDYVTAGSNSCYFGKGNTSLWVTYNITVVATNRLGSNYSDPVDVDVVYIGKLALFMAISHVCLSAGLSCICAAASQN